MTGALTFWAIVAITLGAVTVGVTLAQIDIKGWGPRETARRFVCRTVAVIAWPVVLPLLVVRVLVRDEW